MFLPEDVLIQILLRLPPKSVSRFKCVSKFWEAIIDSDQFMAKYLQLTYTASDSSSNHCLYLISNPSSDLPVSLISLFFSESKDEESQLLELKGHPGITELYGVVSDPEINTWYSHGVSSPINGIYCVKIVLVNPPHPKQQSRIVKTALWNPGVGQFHVLPPIPRPAMLNVLLDLQHDGEWADDEWPDDEWPHYDVDVRYLYAFFCGFAFDPVSQDCKLFCISQYGHPRKGSYYFVCFHLYSLASDSWQELHLSQITYPPYLIKIQPDGLSSYINRYAFPLQDEMAVSLNGSCHWFCSDFEQVHLTSFDIVNHAFDQTSFPARLFGYEAMLTTVDGYLAIVGPPPAATASDFDFNSNEYFDSDPSIIDVSVMKEYGVKDSWMKAYMITLKSPGRHICIVKDKLFVRKEDDGWLVSYRLGAHQDDYNEYGHVPFKYFNILPLEGSLIPIHHVID